MSVDAKFIRDIDPYFQYPTDENPTTQQEYQEAVRNWVTTEEAIVDSHLWQPTTNYNVGNQIKTPSLPPQCVLVCTAAGTSGNEESDYTNVDVGDFVTDGTVTWLVSEVLTSAGGTMGGSLKWDGVNDSIFAVGMSNSTNDNVDIGWKYTDKKGAGIGLRNISHNDGGVFNLWATDGTNVKTLVGKADGEFTWNGKNVLTDATVGNYTSKDIENAINLSVGKARNITNVSLSAGRWLVIGAAKFGDVTASKIYGIQLGTTSGAYSYANSGSVAVQSTNTGPLSLQTVHIFNLSATTTIYLTGYATAACSVDNAVVQAIRIV